MKFYLKTFSIFFILHTNTFGLPLTQNASLDTAYLSNELTTAITAMQNEYDLSSMQLSIATVESKVIVSINKGNISKSSLMPINNDSIFQIGSITKTFTAYAALQLIKQNKLNLHDKVSQYLPEYPGFANVTIEQLINQTSGIYDYSDSTLWWWKLYLLPSTWWTPEKLVALADDKFYFNPGSGWHYSNTNYILLGLIIEKITKEKLVNVFAQDCFNSKLFTLNNTYYLSIPASAQSRLVHGYHNKTDVTNITTSWLQAGGGILSNTLDIVRWYLFYTKQIINNDSYNKDFIQIANGNKFINYADTGYGFAIFSMSTPYGILWFTPGLTPGYTALVGYLPCRNVAFSYIVSSNFSNRGMNTQILSKILPIIYKSFPKSNISNMDICKTRPQIGEINFPEF